MRRRPSRWSCAAALLSLAPALASGAPAVVPPAASEEVAAPRSQGATPPGGEGGRSGGLSLQPRAGGAPPGGQPPASGGTTGTSGQVPPTNAGQPPASGGATGTSGQAPGGAAETSGQAPGTSGLGSGGAAGTSGQAPGATSGPATGPPGQVQGREGAGDPAGAEEPRPPRAKEQAPRVWRVNQRPIVGSEQAWGPPNGQTPTFVEITEPVRDPNQPPPNGLARIAIGAVLGPAGLAVFGAGLAYATMDRFREERRVAVPLIGLGLVTAAVGWGLFAHGILRHKAYLRWEAQRAAALPTFGPRGGGVTFVLRF